MKLSNLPIGAKVQEADSGLVFHIAAQNHPGYTGTTLVSDKIIAQACLDATEPEAESARVIAMGRSDYALSNLHQWLNATGEGWFKPSHVADVPPDRIHVARWNNMYDKESYNPYAEKPGFLAAFSENFRRSILISEVESYKVGGEKILIRARVFLPSVAELGIQTHENYPEGSLLPLFKEFRMRFAMPSEKCLTSSDFRPSNFLAEESWQYWLRSVHPRDEALCCAVHGSNPYVYYPAARPWNGVRPMMNLDGDTQVQQQDSGVFRIG